MTYYLLRPIEEAPEGLPSKYMLSKWGDGNVYPEAVYNMQLTKNSLKVTFDSCDCPSRSNPCKHWPIAEAILTHPEPVPRQNLYWEDGTIHNSDDL